MRASVLYRRLRAGGGAPIAGLDFLLDFVVPADVTAPTLSSPTGAKDTATTYTGSVSTTEGNGGLYWIVQPDTAPTPSTTQISLGLDGSGNPAVGGLNSMVVVASGVQNVSGGGLTNGVGYEIAYYHEDNAGNRSSVAICASFGATDTTAPVLSSPTGTKSGATTYTGTVTTDEANGTLYWIVQADSVATPTAAQIAAGLNGAGAAAVHSGSQAVTATGVQNVSGSGLTNGVGYEIAYYHDDAAGNDSNVVVSAAFGATSNITYLGQVTRSGQAAGTIDLTPLGLQQDDVVLVMDGMSSNSSRTIGVSSAGWTDVDTKATGTDTFVSECVAVYKVMGATPDTSVDVPATGASGDARRTIVRAYRNVNTSTPIDGASGVGFAKSSGINTRLVAPANGITPVTANALIVAFGCGAAVNGETETYNAPSDLTDWDTYVNSGSSRSITVGVGHKVWASGAFTPEAWVGPEVTTTNAWTMFRVALRPA